MQRDQRSCFPLISVVIPVHNRRKFLLSAIRSVLRQTYRSFELIVVDDGSTDGGVESLENNFSGEIFFLYQENRGVSSARNSGVKKAKGEYIAFLDSDDQWDPAKLERQIEWHRQNSGIKISQTQEIWVRKGVRVNPMKKHQKEGGDIFKKSLTMCAISPSSLLIQRDLFLSFKGFDESLPACEDYDLWLRITAQERVGLLDEELITKYGGHGDQLSGKFKVMDRFRIYSIIKLLLEGSLNEVQRFQAKKMLRQKMTILIKGVVKRGNSSHALDQLLKDVETERGDHSVLYAAKQILVTSEWS